MAITAKLREINWRLYDLEVNVYQALQSYVKVSGEQMKVYK